MSNKKHIATTIILAVSAFLGSAIVVPLSAFAVDVSNPDESRIKVLGVHPDPPLVEHVPLGNAISFELDFRNIGDPDLNFTGGKVRYFDRNGNQILPENTIDVPLFESVAVRKGGDDTANSGRITKNQRLFLFFPFEELPLELALAALEQLEHETETVQRHWQLRVERAQYEAERARRQYHTVEPENRLVARNLERQWEDKLRALDELEHAHQRWLGQQAFTLTDSDRHAILALGEDLPMLWQAPTTTSADRKQMLRLVINAVIVDAKRERGRLWYQINWQTGATSAHRLTRKVQRLDEHPQFDASQHRVRALSTAQKMDAEIAAILNAEGFRTARGQGFKGANVRRIRQQWQLPSAKENGNDPHPPRWADGTYSIEGAAAAVGVTVGTVYKWVRQGRVKSQQLAKGMPWKLSLTEADIVSLRAYVKQVRRIKRSTMEAT